MENKKMCVWKRGGYFFIATLLGAGPFSSHVYAGTDHDQFNSVTTELNNGLNQKKGKKVTGTIIDETGEPVIGANVVQKGTTNGSITDIDGRFSLEIPEDAILEISYIGYLTQSIPVKNKSSLQITLREDTQKLDEVIVVGYGSTSVRKNTAALATVDNTKVLEVPFSDMGSSLQGRVPGVIVQQGSAEPGQNGASVSIRGNGDPLYVIDGFVSSSGRFMALNKSDIESMTVLKDAASTAVYGMNAGNGVVVVTTKQGKAGKLSVNYQANFAFNTPSYPAERLNAYEYATAINKLNQSLGNGLNSFRTQEEMAELEANLGSYTNWENALLRNYTPQNEHTVSISGGNDKLKYFGSLNYLGQKGI